MKQTRSMATVAAAAILLFCGCTGSRQQAMVQEPGQNGTDEFTIVASLEAGEATRSTMDGMKVVWEKGDKIAIYFDGYTNRYEMTLNPADAGKTVGRFTGTMNADWVNQHAPIHAIYPADCGLDRTYLNYLTVTVPSVQDYAGGSFGKGANICFANTNDVRSEFVFKNAGGLLGLTVKGDKVVKDIVLTSTGDYLSFSSGLIDKNVAENGYNFTNISGGSHSVTLDCGEGVQLTEDGTEFYIFVPYGCLSGQFSVLIEDTEGGNMEVVATASASNTIERSVITRMPALVYSVEVPSVFGSRTTLGIYDDYSGAATLKTDFLSDPKVQAGAATTSDSNVFRLQNWEDEWVVLFKMPLSLTKGETYDIEVVPETGSSGFSATTLRLKLLSKKNHLAWFVDEATSEGYILNITK